MMKDTRPKFTPGPWYATDLGQIVARNLNHGYPVCIASVNWYDEEGYEAGRKHQKADSALIATAPELYAKLLEVNAHLMYYFGTRVSDSGLNNFELNMYHLEDEIEHLLAKARGED